MEDGSNSNGGGKKPLGKPKDDANYDTEEGLAGSSDSQRSDDQSLNGSDDDSVGRADWHATRRRIRALVSENERLTKSLQAKTSYVTRLKNERQLQSARNAAKVQAAKNQLINCQNTLRSERTSRTQMRNSIRNEFTTKIASSKQMEKDANRRANIAEKESLQARKDSNNAKAEVETLNSRISSFRKDLSASLRERDEMKRRIKELESKIKKLLERLDSHESDKQEKRLAIENAKTERARLEAEARKTAESKRLKEIAANHYSKIGIINEQARIKQQEKQDKEKARKKAAEKKQEDDIKKLDTSFEMYHRSATSAPPDDGEFPGNKALQQLVQSQQQMTELLNKLGGTPGVPPVASVQRNPSPPNTNLDDGFSTPQPKRTKYSTPPPRFLSQTLTQMENILPPAEEEVLDEDPRYIDPSLLPPGVHTVTDRSGMTVYRRKVGDDHKWYFSLKEMDEDFAREARELSFAEEKNDGHEEPPPAEEDEEPSVVQPAAVEILSSSDEEDVREETPTGDLRMMTQDDRPSQSGGRVNRPNQVTPSSSSGPSIASFFSKGGKKNSRPGE